MNIDNVKTFDWRNDFTWGAEFEFKDNVMYETSEGEYERDEEKYVHEEDYGFNDEGTAMSMSMKQNNDLNLYNRDQCRINALLYYAAIHGLGIRLHESGTKQGMFECTIHLTSQCVDAELYATFLCEEVWGAIFESGRSRVEITTEIVGNMECEDYSFSEAFKLIMKFVDFAVAAQIK